MLRLKVRRLILGLSQRQLADASGVYYKYLVLIDSGRLTPTDDQAARIAGVLGVTPETLLDHIDERKLGVGPSVEHKAAQREEKSRGAR